MSGAPVIAEAEVVLLAVELEGEKGAPPLEPSKRALFVEGEEALPAGAA